MVLTAFRPRFADFVLKMPRGAQVIYPKDLGPIAIYADVFPGARVLEAGTGSGALTIALCRAVGPAGASSPTSCAKSIAAQAVDNLEAFFGELPSQLDLREGDLTQIAESGRAVRPCGARHARAVGDRWRHWPGCSSRAGWSCAICPPRSRSSSSCWRCRPNGFLHVETFETLRRGWHVTERSVRPDHRMQGHTGFLTVARRVGGAG